MYRSTFGLGPMNIQLFDQNGNTLSGAVGFDQGWALEQMLDLDMASTACPCCPLIYVGANSAGYPDLLAAINTAINKGAKVGSWRPVSITHCACMCVQTVVMPKEFAHLNLPSLLTSSPSQP